LTQSNPLPHSTPEAQGIPSSAILDFVQVAESELDALHSFILVRHGRRIAQGWWTPYAPEHPHMLFSLSKSFTSTAVGLAVAEGRLSVNDPVLPFFPEEAPAEVSDNLAAMRVRHLLSMVTGHAEDTTRYLHEAQDGNWVKAFLARPVEHAPGTHFLYNTGATYVLSAIVQKLTGTTLLDYLQPRLFEPLGIEGATWETCPRGINTGGFGLSVKTEDIARFGQLYLLKGQWQGQQILPTAWVEEATARQVDNAPNENPEWEQGYGYQFWRCRYNAYRGDGAFGQFCLVMPDQDAVLAVTSGIGNMQAVLDQVWKHLLPAMGSVPRPEDTTAYAALERKLAGLAFLPAQGASWSPMAQKAAARYILEPNEPGVESIGFAFGQDRSTITIRDAHGERQIVCGHGAWVKGTTIDERGRPQKVAASGAWTSEDTYTISPCLYETPFRPTITCRFEQDRLTYTFRTNVGFGPLDRPPLLGRREQIS
jgi:CubicO group peptidase (beta-lactamase class C family)